MTLPALANPQPLGPRLLEDFQTPTGLGLRTAFSHELGFGPFSSAVGYLDQESAGFSLADHMRGPPEGFEPPPTLSREEANERGRQYGLTFDDGEREAVVDHIIEAKRQELIEQSILGRFDSIAGKLTAGLAASVADPLNVAAAFVPVVREARFASMVLRMGATRARLTKGVIEGAAGAALVEPLVLGAARSRQADYDMFDSLLNLAFGTIVGGGLHLGAGAAADAIRAARGAPSVTDRAWRTVALDQLDDDARATFHGMRHDVREALLRTSIAEVAEGRRVDVTPIIKADSLEMARVLDSALRFPTAPDTVRPARLVDAELREILVRKGQGVRNDKGEILVEGRAFRALINKGEAGDRLPRRERRDKAHGLVKAVFKHGELAARPDRKPVTLDDVIGFAQTIRQVTPQTRMEGSKPRLVWDAQRADGETVRYIAGFDKRGQQRGLVTIYVLDREDIPASPASSARGGGDTDPGGQPRPAREAGSAGTQNMAPERPTINEERLYEDQGAARDIEAKAADQQRADANEAAALEEELTQLIEEIQRFEARELLDDIDRSSLKAADDFVNYAKSLGDAYRAAAHCAL